MSKPMTPAETMDWLVQQGAEYGTEVYLTLMKYQGQGGRTPGVTQPRSLKSFFQSTTPAYWQHLQMTDPAEAQSQLQQFKQVGG